MRRMWFSVAVVVTASCISAASWAATFVYAYEQNSNRLQAVRESGGKESIASHSPNGNLLFSLPPQSDPDGDGLSSEEELRVHSTHPTNADSDADGLADGSEILVGADPLNPDSDQDGWSDGEEADLGRSPVVDEAAVLRRLGEWYLLEED